MIVRTEAIALAVTAAVLATTACGSADNEPGIDASPTPECTMKAAISPDQPTLDSIVVVTGSIERQGVSGFEVYEWEIRFDGAPVETSSSDPDNREISFTTTEAGTYVVTLRGEIDAHECADFSEDVNVIDPGGLVALYRLRAAPGPNQPAPVQDQIVSVRGGADAIRDVALSAGQEVVGAVTDGADPLAAYIRITAAGDPAPVEIEAFSGPDGVFQTTLSPGFYDVLVVPADPLRPPIRETGLSLGALATLVVPPGQPVTGTVVDGAGAPVVGARVTAHAGGAPSTVGITDAAGAFALSARLGGPVAVSVVPPAEAGLPALSLAATAGLAPSATIDVQYAPVGARQLALPVTAFDGSTPAPGARVTWLGRPVAGAATATADGAQSAAMTGHAQVVAIADGAGALPTLALPELIYDVVVEPGATGAARLVEIDLSPGNPSPAGLALAEHARIDGVARLPSGEAAAGARVVAVPQGPVAVATSAAAQATADADGEFTLALIGGGRYTLAFEAARPGASEAHATTYVEVTAPDGGHTEPFEPVGLANAVTLTGRVTIPGVVGGAAGVHLLVLCYECTGAEAVRPVAEAVTDANGDYLLRIPDPGVSAAPAPPWR